MKRALPKPTEVIAHREPFIFLDEITDLIPGVSATGRWHLTGDEPFFVGHFPGRPTLPGVLMCESIAQLGAMAVLTEERFADRLPLFAGIDKARFRRQVLPGDVLELEVEIVRLGSRSGKGKGKAMVDGQIAAECQLMFIITD